uniref:Plastid light harvesting protein n=1 Tax=Pseudictyota dubia TaxID=2749911 RepID=A0A7R9Z2E5_9STRA
MKLAVAALLVGSAAAFAPAQVGKATTALSAFENEIGAQPPLGLYDPLGLLKDADQARFDRLRYVELKHGRVAMLAVTGYLFTKAGNRLPGYEDIPSGFAALKAMPPNAWIWTFFTVACLEIMMRDATGEAEFPGDFRNGFDFGWDKQTDEWKRNKRAIELNNGRAAQMGILGLMVHESMGNLSDIAPFS